MDFTCPNNIKFECNGCGLCCGDTEFKTRCILLLEAEAKKIANHTSKRISEFAAETKTIFPYVYEMKKTKDCKCVFLKDNKCSIYELRPLICMFYPFELKFDKKNGLHHFDFTLECPGLNEGKVLLESDFQKLFIVALERLGKF